MLAGEQKQQVKRTKFKKIEVNNWIYNNKRCNNKRCKSSLWRPMAKQQQNKKV